MSDHITPLLKQLGLPVTRENWISFNWPELPDPWTPEDEAQLPPELQEEQDAEPTRDATTVWVESKHPRRGKGPGGGEFTSAGQGAAGGGAEIGPGPTVHVHVHRPEPIPQAAPDYSDRHKVIERALARNGQYTMGTTVGRAERAWLKAHPEHQLVSEEHPPEHGQAVRGAFGKLKGWGGTAPAHTTYKIVPKPQADRYNPEDEEEDSLKAAEEMQVEADRERARKAKQEKGFAKDPRYMAVGDKPFEGPHAEENAGRSGRLIMGGRTRQIVEDRVANAGLKLVDATETPPEVAQVFGLETYPDGATKSALWLSTNQAAARGIEGAMQTLEKRGFRAVAKELRENTTVVFAPQDANKDPRGTYFAAVYQDKQGHQWLTVNTNAEGYVPPGPRGRAANTVGTRIADAIAAAGPNKEVAYQLAEQEWHRIAILHEFGHVLDNLTARAMRKILNLDVKQAAGGDLDTSKGKDWMEQNVSRYAGTNSAEASAEVWTMALEKPDKVPPPLQEWTDLAVKAASAKR